MTMVQVPEGMAVPLKVNIMSNRKVMLTKDAPLSSHLAVYLFVYWTISTSLTSQASKLY